MQRTELNWLIGELRGLSEDLGSLAEHGEQPLVLAIDQGGHASRAIVFDRTGSLIAEAFAPISTYRSGVDRVEHDAAEVLESVRIAIADVCQALGNDTSRIVAAGLATQRSSIVCWDRRDGAALSPVLSWQDRRNARWLQSWHDHAGVVKRITGLQLSPHYGVSKLRWCLDELPAVREAAARKSLAVGPLASWLLYNLLEEQPFVIDPANASRTLLWDLSLGDWSPQLTELAGIPASLLPRSVPSRHSYGTLPLPGRAVPLTACTGDQSAVPFAHGLPDGGTIYLNLGTGAFLQCPLGKDPGTSTPLLRGVVWWDAAGPRYSLEGTVNGAGSALDWLDEQTGLDDHRAAKSLTQAQVENLTIPVFLNAVSGIGSPFWMSHVESRFLGTVPKDELARVAAVIESIAFLIAANVAEMHTVQPGLTRLLASGGLSTSDYLCACIANLTGLHVERTSLREGTATGLAFLVAEAPDAWNPTADITRFTPGENKPLQQRHRRWQQAMLELQELSDQNR